MVGRVVSFSEPAGAVVAVIVVVLVGSENRNVDTGL